MVQGFSYFMEGIMKFIQTMGLIMTVCLVAGSSTNARSAENDNMISTGTGFVSEVVSGVVIGLEEENLDTIADNFVLDKWDCGQEGMKFNKVDIQEPVDEAFVYLPCVFGGYQYYGVDIDASVDNTELVTKNEKCTSEHEEWDVVDNRFYNSYLNCFAPYSLIEYTDNIDSDDLSAFKLMLRNEQLDFRYDNNKELKGYDYRSACDIFDDVYVEITDDVEAYVILEDFKGDWVYIEFDGESSVKNDCFIIKNIVYFEDIVIDSLSFYKEDYYRDGSYIKSRYTGRILNPNDIVINEFGGRAGALKSLKAKISEQFLKDFS